MLPLLGLVLAVSEPAGPGCSKDTDCKGDRVCEEGRCVAPTPSNAGVGPVIPPPPPPPSPEPAQPRTVRRNGLVCVQALDENQELHEVCRLEAGPSTAARSGGTTTAAPVAEPGSGVRVVGDLSIGGGVAILGASGFIAIAPSLSLFGAVGATGSSGVGGVLAIDTNFAFGPGGTLISLGFAPGLRLGSRSHLDLCVGPALLMSSFGSGVFLTGVAEAQGHIELVGPLALHLSLRASFDATGVLVSPTIGLGVAMF